jgi:hypothetical protein
VTASTHIGFEEVRTEFERNFTERGEPARDRRG